MATGAKLIVGSTLPEIAALGTGALAASAAMVAAAGALGYLAGDQVINKGLGFEGSEGQENLGGMIATLLAKLGSDEAKRAIEINLHLDGERIATVVNQQNAKQGNRY